MNKSEDHVRVPYGDTHGGGHKSIRNRRATETTRYQNIEEEFHQRAMKKLHRMIPTDAEQREIIYGILRPDNEIDTDGNQSAEEDNKMRYRDESYSRRPHHIDVSISMSRWHTVPR